LDVAVAREAIEYCKKLNTPFASELRDEEEKLKDQLLEDLEKQRKKVQDIDRDSLKVKFPDKSLSKALKTYVQGRDFLLKGFLYDNTIKTAKLSNKLAHQKEFREERKTLKRKESNTLVKVKTLQEDFKPDVAIFLVAPKEMLHQRIQAATPAEKEKNHHLNDQEMEKRLAEYESSQSALIKALED